MCDAPARAEDPDHGAREPGRAGLCRRADQQEKAAVCQCVNILTSAYDVVL